VQAAMEGEDEIAKTLVKLGANVGYLTRQKKTAIDVAKEKFNHKLAEWLSVEGAEAMKAVEAKRAEDESLRADRELKKSQVRDEDSRRKELGGQLIKAAKMKDPSSHLAALVAQGAAIHFEHDDGTTPLIWASRLGREGIIASLVDLKAEVHHETSLGKTPLAEAAAWGCLHGAVALMRHGADPFRICSDGHTSAMGMAEEFGEDAVAAAFSAHGASGACKEIRGESAEPTGASEQCESPVTLAARQADIDYRLEALQAMHRVAAACFEAGVRGVRLVRVPKAYYNWSLEERRICLGSPSAAHLCKSIIVENRRWVEGTQETRTHAQYFCVLVQYLTAFSADKVLKAVKALNPGLSKKFFNFQHAEGCEELTGYEFNSVAPFGMKRAMPFVISEGIAKLDQCWLGGGHVDVKLSLDVAEFIRVCQPIVADITMAAK